MTQKYVMQKKIGVYSTVPPERLRNARNQRQMYFTPLERKLVHVYEIDLEFARVVRPCLL